jgi:hypothetical protein
MEGHTMTTTDPAGIAAQFGPPPAEPFEVTPSAEDVAFYREHGYLVVDRITTDAEIEWLTAIYEFLFDPDRGDRVVKPVDRSGIRDASLKMTITQVFHPEFRIPGILETTYVRNAKRIGAALLGADLDDLTVWTHMIRKAPGAPIVPPHQDEAYWPPDYDYRNVAGWLALHDVPVEMGCMQFVPGSNAHGVLRHHHYDNPLHHLLEVSEPVDLDTFVACPLRAGGCTFHDPATVHMTGVNTTDRPRLAYPITVQTLPVRRATRRDTPWLQEFLDAGGVEQSSYVADARVLSLP